MGFVADAGGYNGSRPESLGLKLIAGSLYHSAQRASVRRGTGYSGKKKEKSSARFCKLFWGLSA